MGVKQTELSIRQTELGIKQTELEISLRKNREEFELRVLKQENLRRAIEVSSNTLTRISGTVIKEKDNVEKPCLELLTSATAKLQEEINQQ